MTIAVEQDCYGNIQIEPVNTRLRERAVAHLAGFGQPRCRSRIHRPRRRVRKNNNNKEVA
jgi:hypothetical protein